MNDKEIESIRREFRTSMAELTFNSKPIIDYLTKVAQDRIADASSVLARTVEDRIRVVRPEGKLPLLFLMDSILKNVGGVYRELFASRLVQTFTEAYVTMNDHGRYDMERMLKTWPPIFPADLIQTLDDFVKKQRHLTMMQQQQQQQPTTSSSAATYAAGVGPGGYALAQPQPAGHFHPTYSHSHHAQPSLQPPVQRPVDPTVARVIEQLQVLIDHVQRRFYAAPHDRNMQTQLSVLQQLLQVVQSYNIGLDQVRQIETQIQAMWAQLVGTPPALPAHRAQAAPPPVQTSSKNGSSDMSHLLSQFSSNAHLPIITQSSRLPLVKLTREDLMRRYPDAKQHLYEDLELQCNQCGFRYAKTTDGQAKMNAHLDWHFRQNKKRNEESNKAHSREWFLSENDWLKMKNVDTTREQVPTFFEADAAEKEEKLELQKNKEDISEKCILMEDDARQCAVCHEPFESFWHEDDEEWMLKNAVKVNNEFYHATCFQENAGALVSPIAADKRALDEPEELETKPLAKKARKAKASNK